MFPLNKIQADSPTGMAGLYHKIKKTFQKLTIGIVATAAFYGCAAQPIPSLIETNPALVQKQYTIADKKNIMENFRVNPPAHSQSLGDLVLSETYKKNPEIATLIGKLPDIVDGIDVNEAIALRDMCEYLNSLNIKPSIFVQNKAEAENQYKLRIEWEGNSSTPTNWDGLIMHSGNTQFDSLRIKKVVPIGFDPGDKIDYEKLNQQGQLFWSSNSSKGDKDGIEVTINYLKGPELEFVPGEAIKNLIQIHVNGRLLTFGLYDFLDNPLTFDENNKLEGKLTIANANRSNISRQESAVKEFVLEGQNKYGQYPTGALPVSQR